MLQKNSPVSHLEVFVKLSNIKIIKLIVFISILFGFYFYPYINSNLLEIYFLNVGQGDSILIKSPDNKYILIDTGPDRAVVEQLGKYMPFWDKRIDYLLLTHPDKDHIGGYEGLIASYKIGSIIYTGKQGDSELYRQFEELAKDENYINVGVYDDFNLGCCIVFDIIWPDATIISHETTNNTSYGFILKYNNFNAFFGGDLESGYEDQLSIRYPYDIDLLKVGHHGSKNSTSQQFLKRFKPEIAIIQVGKDNSYGHPSGEVIELLNLNHIKYYINYEYDQLYFKSDGNNVFHYSR